MKSRSVLLYSVLRLLAFLVPLGIMLLFPIFRELYWLAILFAALIGLSLSIIFLRRPLDDVSAGLAARREQRAERTAAEKDADVEDAANAALRHEDADAPAADGASGAPDAGPAPRRREDGTAPVPLPSAADDPAGTHPRAEG